MATDEDAARAIRRASVTVVRLAAEIDRLSAVLLGVLLALTTLLGIGFILSAGALVGAIPSVVSNGLDSTAGARALRYLGLAVGFFVLQQALLPLRAALAERLGRRVDGALRRRVMRATLAPVGISHLEDPRMLDRVASAQAVGLGHVRPGDAVGGVVDNFSQHLRILGAAVLVAGFEPMIAVALVSTSWYTRSRLLSESSKRISLVRGQAHELRRSHYYRDLLLTPESAKETRLFGLAPWVVDRFKALATGTLERVWAERTTGRVRPLLWFLPSVFVIFASFFILGRDVAAGRVTLEQLAVAGPAILAAGAWFVGDSDLLVQYGGSAIAPALELERELATRPQPSPSGRAAVGLPREEVRFEGVLFRYPKTERVVFEELDLRIEAGRSLAIVGRNGAGKTTLVKLLCGLYEPVGGRIIVDGAPLAGIDIDEWRGQIAVIFQDFIHYDLTVRDNLAVAAPELAADTARLERAAERAGALDIVRSLPRGWDTVVAREYSGGVELSGGQWQRIALARALVAVEAGAKVLILDEPTASLDPRAEAELFDRFIDITHGLTTILISHRFGTVRHADRICVLDDGRVVEDGTHERLLAETGLYAEMFKLQAARFEATPLGQTDA